MFELAEEPHRAARDRKCTIGATVDWNSRPALHTRDNWSLDSRRLSTRKELVTKRSQRARVAARKKGEDAMQNMDDLAYVPVCVEEQQILGSRADSRGNALGGPIENHCRSTED